MWDGLPVEEVHEQEEEGGGGEAHEAVDVLYTPLAEGREHGALEFVGRGHGEVEGGG